MVSPPPARDAELQLCRRVAAGDRVAAEALVRALLPIVRRTAGRLTRTPSDADDAAQVATMEILRSAKHYSARGSLQRWAGRIAVRAIMRWNQRHGTRPPSETDPDHDLGTAPPDSWSEGLPRPLQVYLDALPERQRTALVLRHSLGYTVAEIAELTDAPIPTVRSRVGKAITRVRAAIRRDIGFGIRGAMP